MVLLTILLAAEYRHSTSMGDPQNYIDPFPNNLRELFLLTYIDGLTESFVDPWLVMDMVTPMDPTVVSQVAWIRLIVSGVIARWMSLVSLIWRLDPNRVELRLHVEHTESMAFPMPKSDASLQTIHPAQRPLISFPGFTTVEWVVMDIGSIQSSSGQCLSFAALTLMLFPLMTVLETTGSMVHIVATAFGVLHLTRLMNFRSSPPTPGSNPIAVLNAPINVVVNESSDGTPLCLNNADRTSDAVNGGNSFLAWVTNVCTSSVVLINLSLSCSKKKKRSAAAAAPGFVSCLTVAETWPMMDSLGPLSAENKHKDKPGPLVDFNQNSIRHKSNAMC